MPSLNTDTDSIYQYNEARLKETRKFISCHKSKQFKVMVNSKFSKGGFYLEVVGDPSCGGLGAQPPAADEGVIIDIL